MKLIIIMLFLFTAIIFPQSNQLTNYDRASEIDSLLNDIKNRLWTTDGHTQAISTITGLQDALNAKQATLVSGTNIKTVNGNPIVGSGNINLDSTGGDINWRTPEQFGAVGDGVTNDFQAFREAFQSYSYENTGEETYAGTISVKLGAGKTYRWNPNYTPPQQISGLTLASDLTELKYLYVEGNGAIIDIDTINMVSMFNITGTDPNEDPGGWTPAPTAYLRGDMFIRVDTSISNNTSRGDVIWISCAPDHGSTGALPDWVYNSVNKGELVEVNRVVIGEGETAVDTFSTTTIGLSTKTWSPSNYVSLTVRIVSGTGAGQSRAIRSNTATTLTVFTWTTTPDSTSIFVIDTALELITGLRDFYTVEDSAVVRRQESPTVIIRNLTLKATPRTLEDGRSARGGLGIYWAKNVLIENVTIMGFESQALGINESINVLVNNVTTRDFQSIPNLGLNYGLVASGCMDLTVINSDMRGGRHGIDIGSSVRLPSYNNRVINNIIGRSPRAYATSAFATHPGVKNLSIIGNVVYGHLGTRSSHNYIADNFITEYVLPDRNEVNESDPPTGGIGIGNGWDDSGGWNIIKNNVIDVRWGGINIYQGNISRNQTTGDTVGTITNFLIEGNYIVGSHLANVSNYYLENPKYNLIQNAIIRNNVFIKSPNTVLNVPIAVIMLYGAEDTTIIDNFVFENNVIRGIEHGLRFYGAHEDTAKLFIKKALIKDNIFGTRTGITSVAQFDAEDIDISGNVFDKSESNAAGGVLPVSFSPLSNLGTVKIFDNTVHNAGNGSGSVAYTLTADRIYFGLNRYTGTSTGWVETLTATSLYELNWITVP